MFCWKRGTPKRVGEIARKGATERPAPPRHTATVKRAAKSSAGDAAAAATRSRERPRRSTSCYVNH
nr:hypothetical protein Iba_chr04cCG13900 [Ipomoea batatas]